MQSNSKLSDFEKRCLKQFCDANPDVKFATMGKTTIAFQHVGDLVEFATAICADNEKKNRNKVGKYWAMTRFENGQTVKLPFTQFGITLQN
jgi:hypothetical protein